MRYLKDQNDGYYLSEGGPAPGWVEISQAEYLAQNPFAFPSSQQLINATLTKARAMRLDIFKVLDGLQVSALVNADTTLAQQIEASKQALRDLPQQVDLAQFTTAKQMEEAIQAAYFAVAAQAPASVRSAFASLVP